MIILIRRIPDPRMAEPLILGSLHIGGVGRRVAITTRVDWATAILMSVVTVTDVRARTSWAVRARG